MSLELAIKENTAAITALIGVWSKLMQKGQNINTQVEAGTTTTEKVVASTVEKAAPKPAPVAEAAAGPATATDVAPAVTASASPPPVASAASVAPASTAATDDPIVYATVSKAITDGVKISRAAVVGTLQKFGVTKGTELTPDQFGDFLYALAGAVAL